MLVPQPQQDSRGVGVSPTTRNRLSPSQDWHIPTHSLEPSVHPYALFVMLQAISDACTCAKNLNACYWALSLWISLSKGFAAKLPREKMSILASKMPLRPLITKVRFTEATGF